VCATLTGRTIVISDIRPNGSSDSTDPGLRDFEANFLRLMEKVSNGCEIVINETGTKVTYKPGMITGGTIVHDCSLTRAIGYYLEPLICLAPFSKQPFNVTLNGITNEENDISVDLIRTVTLPLIKNFGIEDGLELKVTKRGAPPSGGGQIRFKSPIVRQLNPIQLLDEGKIRRIRGIVYTTRVNPTISSRIIEAAKTILTKFQQDVYIFNDHYKGSESGLSPGYGLSLVAETTSGTALANECIAPQNSGNKTPEDIGKEAANLLLTEIMNRGCVDSGNQSIVLLFMVLCPETISKVRLGKLSPYGIETLRHIKEFFGVTFKVETDMETKTVLCTCRGVGFRNLAKRVW